VGRREVLSAPGAREHDIRLIIPEARMAPPVVNQPERTDGPGLRVREEHLHPGRRRRTQGHYAKALLAMEALLDGEAETITRVAVDKAKEGDTTALRLCLERILPPRKDRPVSFSLPQLGDRCASRYGSDCRGGRGGGHHGFGRVRARPSSRYLRARRRGVGSRQASAGNRGEDGQMRSREMHNKLDKLALSAEGDEQTFHDLTMLSPEDQDWVDELTEKIRNAEDGSKDVITEAEARKLHDLLSELPVLGPDDKLGGPDLEIPREIETHFQLAKWHEEGRYHWPRFDFHKLRAVQKVRFVELCRQYGWEGEYPRDRSRHHADYFKLGSWKIPGLLPLSQWDPEDEAELRSLLDTAERCGR
jgi:hypothetical protein